MAEFQTIGSLVQMSRGSAATTSLQPLSPPNAAVLACRRQYGSARGFLTAYSPTNQGRYCTPANLRALYRGDAPQLGVVALAFGRECPALWLGGQLRDLALFSGAREKLTAAHYQQLADIIINNWGYLKVTEVMHFFHRFKAGDFGRFYGAVDPLAIMEAFRAFVRERYDLQCRFEQQERDAESARLMEQQQAEVDEFNGWLAAHGLTIADYLRFCDQGLTTREAIERELPKGGKQAYEAQKGGAR